MFWGENAPGVSWFDAEVIILALATWRQQVLTQSPVRVELKRNVRGELLIDLLWRIYCRSRLIVKLQVEGGQRELLTQFEFERILTDERIIKFLIYHTEKIVGVVFATNDFEVLTEYGAGKWLSQEFYQTRFSCELESGDLYYLLAGGVSLSLVEGPFIADRLDWVWYQILDELKELGATVLAYDYSEKVASLTESFAATFRRMWQQLCCRRPEQLGVENYLRFRWPASNLAETKDVLTFSVERVPRQSLFDWGQAHQRRLKARARTFAWLESEGLVNEVQPLVHFIIQPVPFKEITSELIEKVYSVSRAAFSGIPEHPDPEMRLTHNQRSPHRQQESLEEFAKDLQDADATRLFVGSIKGRIVFYCLIRLGLDERGPDGLGVGGMTCLNYEPLQVHLRRELQLGRVAFIPSIGMLPACQGLMGNWESLQGMSFMLDKVLPQGGVIGFDVAMTINPRLARLHRWLALRKGWLPRVGRVCDSHVYEYVRL